MQKKYLFTLLGHFVTIKKNVKNHNDGIKVNSERLAQVEKTQECILASCSRMEEMIKQISFHVVMDTETIDHLFPIDSNTAVESFMSNSDGRFVKRKRELEKLIFSVWSPNITKRQFSDNLINTLFTRNYIATHRWPHIG